jgi:AcrR family transcriptional regulator
MAARQADPRRAPRQERARSTVASIVEATARVVAEAGLDRATTSRIAHVAGVSIGSLYQYFPGKQALFSALIENQAACDVDSVRNAVDTSRGLPLEERIVRAFDAGFSPILARPRLYIWIFTYMPALGLLPVARKLERELAVELRRLLLEHPDELGHVDTDLLILGGIGALRGALITLAHHRPDLLEDAASLREELIAIVQGALAGVRCRTRQVLERRRPP